MAWKLPVFLLAGFNAFLDIYSLKQTLDLSSQNKAQAMLEMPEMESEMDELENRLEAQDVEEASSSQQEEQKLLKKKKEEVQKLFNDVKQNFGKINVAPEFSEEDLVPVEMLDMMEASGSEDEEEEEEEEKEQVEEETGEQQEEESSVSESTAKAGKKSTEEVNKEMDEKIAKLKHFLDRAKSKHFSAIRFVYSSVVLLIWVYSLGLIYIMVQCVVFVFTGFLKAFLKRCLLKP